MMDSKTSLPKCAVKEPSGYVVIITVIAFLVCVVSIAFAIESCGGYNRDAYILMTYIHSDARHHKGIVIFTYDNKMCNVGVITSTDKEHVKSVLNEKYPVDTEHKLHTLGDECFIIGSESFNYETVTKYTYALTAIIMSLTVIFISILYCSRF